MAEIVGISEESLTAQGMERLENWAVWAGKGECAMVLRHFYPRRAAVCGNYKSTETYDDPDEKALALWAVEQVRKFGGVLEHPKRSTLWPAAGLPEIEERDEYELEWFTATATTTT